MCEVVWLEYGLYAPKCTPTFIKKRQLAGCWWLTPVILATWEGEIRRMEVSDQSGKKVCETPISKIARASVKP
jgi:hypothetical protein